MEQSVPKLTDVGLAVFTTELTARMPMLQEPDPHLLWAVKDENWRSKEDGSRFRAISRQWISWASETVIDHLRYWQEPAKESRPQIRLRTNTKRIRPEGSANSRFSDGF